MRYEELKGILEELEVIGKEPTAEELLNKNTKPIKTYSQLSTNQLEFKNPFSGKPIKLNLKIKKRKK